MVSRSRNFSGPPDLNRSADYDIFEMPNFEPDVKESPSMLNGCDGLSFANSFIDFELHPLNLGNPFDLPELYRSASANA